MIRKDTVYTVGINRKLYFFEQDCFFCEASNCINAVNLYASYEDDAGRRCRRLISGLTFQELCGLKEAVDEIFENLLPRYCDANPDMARLLLQSHPWLKERADVNPLFGSGEKQEEE
jgi:hypothetical protein